MATLPWMASNGIKSQHVYVRPIALNLFAHPSPQMIQHAALRLTTMVYHPTRPINHSNLMLFAYSRTRHPWMGNSASLASMVVLYKCTCFMLISGEAHRQ